MDFHRIGIKFFAADPSSIRLEEFIPVFHGWIQKQSLTGHLLIDVHDYRHIQDGPGILLVAHEGNFSIDTNGGRPGLMYYRKTPTTLSPADHLKTVFRSALQAVHLLEKHPRIRFGMDEFVVLANDRLHAPNDDQSLKTLLPALTDALKHTFETADFDVTRTSLDPKERLTITCRRRS